MGFLTSEAFLTIGLVVGSTIGIHLVLWAADIGKRIDRVEKRLGRRIDWADERTNRVEDRLERRIDRVRKELGR